MTTTPVAGSIVKFVEPEELISSGSCAAGILVLESRLATPLASALPLIMLVISSNAAFMSALAEAGLSVPESTFVVEILFAFAGQAIVFPPCYLIRLS